MSKKRGADVDVAAEEDLKKLVVKHAGLKQDYNELQRETRAMKKRLQRAKLKKDNLLAEVRFLRRRHRLLTKKSSESQVNGAPPLKQSLPALQAVGAEYAYAMHMKHPVPVQAAQAIGAEYDYAMHVKHPKPVQAAQPMAAEYEYATGDTSSEEDVPQTIRNVPFTMAEFGHLSENKPSAAREFQVFWEPLRTTGRQEAPSYVETVKRKPVLENGGLASDLNLSIFKDIPNGFVLPNRTGKRKNSWQDQMALRV